MRHYLLPLLRDSLQAIGAPDNTEIALDLPRTSTRGDLATGVAFALAGILGREPKEIAKDIILRLPIDPKLVDVKVAGAGFINFRFMPEFFHRALRDILAAGGEYGRSNQAEERNAAVAFLEPPVTGPADGDHGRGIAIADAITSLLDYSGYQVERLKATAGPKKDPNLFVAVIRASHLAAQPDVTATIPSLGNNTPIRIAAFQPVTFIEGEKEDNSGDASSVDPLSDDTMSGDATSSDAASIDATSADPSADGSLAPLTEAAATSAAPSEAAEQPTLDALHEITGADVATFFFLMRERTARLDFNLDLARAQSEINPFYFVQYARERAASILRHAEMEGIATTGDAEISQLRHATEVALIRQIFLFPEMVARAARDLEPKILTDYLRDVATAFNAFHTECRIIPEEPPIRDARLRLVAASATTLTNGLAALGITDR